MAQRDPQHCSQCGVLAAGKRTGRHPRKGTYPTRSGTIDVSTAIGVRGNAGWGHHPLVVGPIGVAAHSGAAQQCLDGNLSLVHRILDVPDKFVVVQ
jgi:hypothetical protein